MKLRELPQVMALSTEEKLDLIEDLWESIYPEMEAGGVPDEEKKLLNARWENYLKKPDSALTMEQFETLLANRRK